MEPPFRGERGSEDGRIRTRSVLRLHRALLLETLAVLVIVTFLLAGAVFAGATLRFIHEGGSALGSSLMLDLLPKLLPLALVFSLPFSWLAALALVVGRWISDHEVTAARTAGMSDGVLSLPLIALGAVLGAGMIGFNGYVEPVAHRDVRTNVKNFVPKFLASLRGLDRSISLSNGRLSFDHYADGWFYNVELEQRTSDGALQNKVLARALRLETVGEDSDALSLRLVIHNGVLLRVGEGGGWEAGEPRDRLVLQMGRIEKVAATTLFNDFFMTKPYEYKPKDMTLKELAYVIARGGVERGTAQHAQIALHGRLALGAAPFFLGLFALGVLLRIPPPGRRVRDFVLCVAPAILVFFPLYLVGPSLARSHDVAPWLAMWLPHLVLGAAALFLHSPLARRG